MKCTPLTTGYRSDLCVGGSGGGGGGGTCGGGNRGNGICSTGECCSQYGWCGTSAAHCGGGGGGGGGTRAYVTYHNYYAGQQLTDVSCSNGENGLMTRWRYSTIDPMGIYVTATSNSPWNSPNCGKCYEVRGTVKTVYLTAIDSCAAGPSGEMHFDIHPAAFIEAMGEQGRWAGHGYVTYREVPSSNCQGNKG